VTVTVSELKRNFSSLKPENSLQDFSEIFAIYLKNYRDASISLAGQRIDAALAIISISINSYDWHARSACSMTASIS